MIFFASLQIALILLHHFVFKIVESARPHTFLHEVASRLVILEVRYVLIYQIAIKNVCRHNDGKKNHSTSFPLVLPIFKYNHALKFAYNYSWY